MRSDWQNYKAGFPSSSVLFHALTEERIPWATAEVEGTQTRDISEAMRARQTHPGRKGCNAGNIPLSLTHYNL